MADSREKFALITGCGPGGIGQALAREFKQHGYTTIATLLPHEQRDHLLAGDIICVNTDVTKDESVAELLETVDKISGSRLDILVNNAGIAYTMPATDTEIPEVEAMFAVNVFGPMRMVQYFHKLIISARGTVVNIGSVGGIVPFIYGASYNASKCALVHYGNTLRAEMQPFGVKVVNIISGEVSTNILRRDQDRGRQLPPDSVFAPLANEFQNHLHRTPNTMTADEYALGVVREVIKTNPRAWYWRGAQTGIVWFADTFLWRTFWDWLFWRMFDLGKLARPKVE